MGIAGLAQVQEGGAVRRPGPVVLCAIALAGFAAAAASIALAVTSDHLSHKVIQTALMVWVVLGYVLAGVVAWWRRPESRFGPLLIVAGTVAWLSSLSWSNAGALFTLGILFDLAVAVVFLHVFLAFPTGHVTTRAERIVLAVGYLAALPVQIAGLLLGGFGPDDILDVAGQAETAYSLLRIQLGVISACLLVGLALLVVRRRASGPPLRRSLSLLIDSFAVALVMMAVLLSAGALGLISGQPGFEWLRHATFFVLGLAPIAFLVGLLEAQLVRSGVADLLVELRSNPEPADLRAAIARALRDPSLTLVYWLPEYEAWADLDGRTVALDELAAGRGTTLIDRKDAHVAALVHDPALDDEPQLLDAVVAGAAIALENAQLHAELQARLDELQGSRARIVEAGDSERRRLERNLHDGAQQRLVALSLGLRAVSTRLAPDSEAVAMLAAAREELTASLQELRDLAQGIHPAVLSDYGLVVALESLVSRSPVIVDLDVAIEDRLPPQVEVAAYYLVSEGLTNVAKYAHATLATVGVRRVDDTLVVEVADNGVGGADAGGGSGLRGLADRVEALGGRLQLRSAPTMGTLLRADIPCA